MPVDDFAVDLVGEELGSGRNGIIENQLERTNHNRWGKLLTYSAGKNGWVIIWVAREIRQSTAMLSIGSITLPRET